MGLATAVIGVCLAWVFWRDGWSDDGLRAAMRVTARTSFWFFLAAFSASPAAALLPSAATRWQLRNRRYLGVAFAVSHLVHAGAILAQAARTGGGSLAGRAHDVIGGGVIYAFIVFMLATSFDRSAAWVGPKAWKAVHTIGAWLIALTFLSSYGGRALESPLYLPQALLLLLALAARIALRVSRRSRG